MLGEPVVKVDITDEQLEDAIETAVELFNEYHHEAADHVYLAYEMTEQDAANKHLTLPNIVSDVVRVVDFNDGAALGWSSLGSSLSPISGYRPIGFAFGGWVAGGYGSLDPSAGTGFPNFAMMRLLDVQAAESDMLYPEIPIRYNRYSRKLYFDAHPSRITPGKVIAVYNRYSRKLYFDAHPSRITPGKVIAVECFIPLTASDGPVWNDFWLRNYATACAGVAWGSNYQKFGNIQPFGGNTTLQATEILERYEAMKEKLEQELYENYTSYVPFIVG